MAVVNIEFVATSNLGAMAAEINRVNSSLKTLNQNLNASHIAQVDQAFKSFNASVSNSGQYTTHLATVASAEARWGKQLSENKLRLRDYGKELSAHIRQRDSMIKKLAAQQAAIARSTIISRGIDDKGQRLVNITTPTGIDMNGKNFELAAKRAQIFNEVISKGAGKVIDLGKNVQWAGRQMMVGMTIPVGIFAAAAGKAFYNLDQQLTRLVKVYGNLGTALSGDQIESLRKQVVGLGKDLAATYGASMDQTVGLAADFAATGAEGVDLLNQTAAATRLAVLGEVDRQDAMKTTLSLTSAFKVQTKDLADAVNFLNAVENQTSVSLQDLTVAIPKAGPVVKGLGGDFKDLALYMTAMKEGGISAGEGANAIKSGLVSIINPTQKAIDFLEKFQINLPQIVKDNAGDITATILELKQALDTLDPLSRQQALATLFQKYQVSRMTALFNNIGEEGSQTQRVLEMIKADSKDLAAVADRELNTIANSASGKWNRALETFKANLAGIGEEFLTIGTWAVNAATEVIKFFEKLPDWTKNVIIIGTILAALVGPIVMTAGIFLNFLGTLVKGAVFLKMLINRTRGLGGAFEYLTPEIFAANSISEKMEKTMYNQTEATNVLTGALKVLEETLGGVIAKSETANLSLTELQDVESLLARQSARPYQAFQAGHVVPRELYSKALANDPRYAKGNATLAYGLTMGMESIGSNANKVAGTVYSPLPGLKQFDPGTLIRSGASVQAWETTLAQFNKSIQSKMGNILNQYVKAMEKAGGDVAMQRAAREQFIQRMQGSTGGKFMAAFQKQFADAERMLAAEFVRVAGLSDDAVLKELEATSKRLGLDYQMMLERINKGTLEARSALVANTTSILSVDAMNAAKNPARTAPYTSVVAGKAGSQKTPSRGMIVASILENDYRLINDERDILNKHLLAAEVRDGIATREVAAAKAEAKASKRRFGGKAMGVGMALSAIPMFMPNTGNASVDNATNILGGAGMGASMGMLAGPWGALAGGIIGGAIPAVQTLIDKMGEFKRVTDAAFSLGEDAATRYGKSIKKVTEIQVSQMLGNSGVRLTKVEEIKNAMLSQPEDSADRELINFIAGEGDGSAIMGRMKQRVAQLVIAGVDKKDIQDQIAAILLAAGKAGYAIPINAQLQKDGMYSLKGSLEDQIKDVTGVRDPVVQAAQDFRSKVEAAFGSNAQNIINELSTGTFSESTFNMSKEQIDVLNQLAKEWANLSKETQWAAREATLYNQDLTPLVSTLANAATTTPVDQFMKMSETLDTSALSASSFAEAFAKIPGIGEDAVAAMNMLAQSGATSTEMLQGIALVNAGVIRSWQELQSIGPAYLKVIYQTSVAENKIVDNAANAGATIFDDKAKAAEAASGSGGTGGGGSSKKKGGSGDDGLSKKRKAIQDYYDAEIKKIKDREKARQDAADAEKRRLDRQKRDMQSMIDYREALAAGDFAAAAKARIEIQKNRQQDRIEDRDRNAKSVADKKIAALEAERDAKLDALDKIKAAQASTDAANVTSATNAKNKIAEGYRDIADEFRKLADGNVTDFDTTMKKIIALAKTHGISLKSTIKDTLYNLNFPDGFKDTGKEIFNVIKNDLSKAPWSMVGEVVEAAMAGNTALLARRINSLKVYIGAGGGKKGAAAVGNVNKSSDPRFAAASGGHVRGAGTATSDSIPAWLSNGEYVIKAAAVGRYGVDFMDRINSMKFAAGGMVGAIGHNAWKHAFSNALFSTGGYASKMNYAQGGFATGGFGGNMVVNMNIMEPGCSAEEIVRVFERKVAQKQRRVGYVR